MLYGFGSSRQQHGLKAVIERRTAIELVVEPPKTYGCPDDPLPKTRVRAALHGVICGADHNLRKVSSTLQLRFARARLALRATRGPIVVCTASVSRCQPKKASGQDKRLD